MSWGGGGGAAGEIRGRPSREGGPPREGSMSSICVIIWSCGDCATATGLTDPAIVLLRGAQQQQHIPHKLGSTSHGLLQIWKNLPCQAKLPSLRRRGTTVRRKRWHCPFSDPPSVPLRDRKPTVGSSVKKFARCTPTELKPPAGGLRSTLQGVSQCFERRRS